jgi:hypothetical protein
VNKLFRISKFDMENTKDQEFGLPDTAVDILNKGLQDGVLKEDIIFKGRVEIGKVRNWGGREMKKVAEGKWVPVKEGKKGKKEEDSKKTDQPKKELHEHAQSASEGALQSAAKNAKDSEVRTAANTELDRRDKQEKVEFDESKKDEDSVLSTKVKEYRNKIKGWSDKQKSFFKEGHHKPGSETRRGLAKLLKDKGAGIVKAVKHEIDDFKMAGIAIGKMFSGKKPDKKEMKALKTAGKHLALTVGTIALTGGTGHLIHKGAAGALKGLFTHYMEHVGATTLGRALIFASDDQDFPEEEYNAEEMFTQLLMGFAEYLENSDIPIDEWVNIIGQNEESEDEAALMEALEGEEEDTTLEKEKL